MKTEVVIGPDTCAQKAGHPRNATKMLRHACAGGAMYALKDSGIPKADVYEKSLNFAKGCRSFEKKKQLHNGNRPIPITGRSVRERLTWVKDYAWAYDQIECPAEYFRVPTLRDMAFAMLGRLKDDRFISLLKSDVFVLPPMGFKDTIKAIKPDRFQEIMENGRKWLAEEATRNHRT